MAINIIKIKSSIHDVMSIPSNVLAIFDTPTSIFVLKIIEKYGEAINIKFYYLNNALS